MNVLKKKPVREQSKTGSGRKRSAGSRWLPVMARLRLSHRALSSGGSEGELLHLQIRKWGPFHLSPRQSIYYVPSYGKVAQL